MTSFARSVSVMYPLGDSTPTSPVRSQPSSLNFSGSGSSSPMYVDVIHGPRTSSSPTDSLSFGITSPAGPTIRAATAAGTRPWVYRYAQASSPATPAGGRDTEPSGDISVMPHAWMISTPRWWNACIRDGGQADPPTTASSSDEMSVGCWLMYARRSVQIVGTAPASVGRSASIIAASGAACRNRSGMTSVAPDINAAYGSPHAIAWNIGTITSSRVCGDRPNASFAQTCIECNQMDRCE